MSVPLAESMRRISGLLQSGQYQDAELLLRRRLAAAPASSPTLTTLGELLLLSGRSAEALPLLRRAIQGTPPHPRAAFLLARHYLGTGQPSLALEVVAPWCNS